MFGLCGRPGGDRAVRHHGVDERRGSTVAGRDVPRLRGAPQGGRRPRPRRLPRQLLARLEVQPLGAQGRARPPRGRPARRQERAVRRRPPRQRSKGPSRSRFFFS